MLMFFFFFFFFLRLFRLCGSAVDASSAGSIFRVEGARAGDVDLNKFLFFPCVFSFFSLSKNAVLFWIYAKAL